MEKFIICLVKELATLFTEMDSIETIPPKKHFPYHKFIFKYNDNVSLKNKSTILENFLKRKNINYNIAMFEKGYLHSYSITFEWDTNSIKCIFCADIIDE